jgi:hypothetical protein
VGDKLDVALIRDKKPMHLTAVITELPTPTIRAGQTSASDTGAVHPGLVGATLADAADGGVEIRAVEPRSAAAQMFRKGDLIEGANRQAVTNLKELRAVARRGGALELKIRRGNAVVLVPLRAP